MGRLAESDPDAAFLKAKTIPPDDATVPEWAGATWRAFWRLQFDRQITGMGPPAPIAFATIDAYARRYGIVGEDFEVFHRLIVAMDGEFLAHIARKEGAASDG